MIFQDLYQRLEVFFRPISNLLILLCYKACSRQTRNWRRITGLVLVLPSTPVKTPMAIAMVTSAQRSGTISPTGTPPPGQTSLSLLITPPSAGVCVSNCTYWWILYCALCSPVHCRELMQDLHDNAWKKIQHILNFNYLWLNSKFFIFFFFLVINHKLIFWFTFFRSLQVEGIFYKKKNLECISVSVFIQNSILNYFIGKLIFKRLYMYVLFKRYTWLMISIMSYKDINSLYT